MTEPMNEEQRERWGSRTRLESGLEYEIHRSGRKGEPERFIYISHYNGKSPVVEIPAEIAGLPVTHIGDFAFAGCDHVTTVKLPECLTDINCDAFCDCTALAEINIPDACDGFGGDAFKNCPSLPAETRALLKERDYFGLAGIFGEDDEDEEPSQNDTENAEAIVDITVQPDHSEPDGNPEETLEYCLRELPADLWPFDPDEYDGIHPMRRDFRMALALIKTGANVNLPDTQGRTPLHLAALNCEGPELLTLAEALVNNGADVNAVDIEGNTPLILAVKTYFEAEQRLSRYDFIEYLLTHGADAEHKNHEDTPAEFAASLIGSPVIWQLLYSHYREPSQKPLSEGRAALGKKDFSKAAQCFKAVWEAKPGNRSAAFSYGDACLYLEQWDEAFRAFSAVKREGRETPMHEARRRTAAFYTAIAHYKKTGEAAPARSALDEMGMDIVHNYLDCAPHAALAIEVLSALETDSTQGISLLLGFLHLYYTKPADSGKALEHFIKAAKWHSTTADSANANPVYRITAARKIIQIIGPYASGEELKPRLERAWEIRGEVKLRWCAQFDKAGDDYFEKGDFDEAQTGWKRALYEGGGYLDEAGKAAINAKLVQLEIKNERNH
ncbi:hypothetical protein AGMMS50293_13770 [Spirochaetia bacterium]|nr:hypothetical protein AGMMS50293_13770 [Spirochaetia bacterium]